jgi:hypothetical protein
MLCCAMLVLVIGVFRTGWSLLRGSDRESEPGFAPPARRPAPGPEPSGRGLAGTDRRTSDRTPTASPARGRPLLRVGWLFIALGTSGYAAVIGGMVELGVAEVLPGPGAAWMVRNAVLGVVIVVAAVGAGRSTGGWPSGRHALVCGLFVVGMTWSVVGVADMHVFAVLEVGRGSPGGDLVFHGSGIALVAAGLLTRSWGSGFGTPVGAPSLGERRSSGC